MICDEIMGTPFYMAPEVYRRRYGPACDFWSLGVVLFLMVSGVPPFWPKKGLDVAHDVLHGRLRFNHPNWAEISKPCIDLVRRMLDKDPITRITGAEILGERCVAMCSPWSCFELRGARLKWYLLHVCWLDV